MNIRQFYKEIGAIDDDLIMESAVLMLTSQNRHTHSTPKSV
ncbi:hypothetical protein SAMN05421730_1008119 [Anaerobium acetethylicum]|uniref:Uncharacterized protein n=1 Tax=Anaerobium acetethylicum TaxID=1619234 RepID=A0A1D3TT68_9FIRM|nr:hypothetical protein SAMN05421730_1008119 [Anaerobium acetethylicum]